jgi:hypothetical protein
MSDLIVSLPSPCGEKWEGMAVSGCNRHCAACDTVIHDLSLMTVGEAENLLAAKEEICVKAIVRPDGTVRTAKTRTRTSRRMVTTVGVSLSLATAACQTASPQVSPRYEVAGQVKLENWSSTAKLVSATGKTYSFSIRSDRKFRFANLRPGTYTLFFYGSCNEEHKIENIVVHDDLNLGELEWNDEGDCIIIGKLKPTGDIGLG